LIGLAPSLSIKQWRPGTSLDIFKKWAGDERNMVIMPGYCVAGTVGAKVLAGQKQVRSLVHQKFNLLNISPQSYAISF